MIFENKNDVLFIYLIESKIEFLFYKIIKNIVNNRLRIP